MTRTEALKLALEALENELFVDTTNDQEVFEAAELMSEAIAAINEVLAQNPKLEPVARVIDDGTPEGATEWIPYDQRIEPLKTGDLLYTDFPDRPWVWLTDAEREKVLDSVPPDNLGGEYYNKEITAIAFAIEAKLKEKNNVDS